MSVVLCDPDDGFFDSEEQHNEIIDNLMDILLNDWEEDSHRLDYYDYVSYIDDRWDSPAYNELEDDVLDRIGCQGSTPRERFFSYHVCPCCARPLRDYPYKTRRTRLKNYSYGMVNLNHRSWSKRKTLRTHRDGSHH